MCTLLVLASRFCWLVEWECKSDRVRRMESRRVTNCDQSGLISSMKVARRSTWYYSRHVNPLDGLSLTLTGSISRRLTCPHVLSALPRPTGLAEVSEDAHMVQRSIESVSQRHSRAEESRGGWARGLDPSAAWRWPTVVMIYVWQLKNECQVAARCCSYTPMWLDTGRHQER